MGKIAKTRISAIVLCFALIVTSAVFWSCKEKNEGNVVGTGKTSFTVEITGINGETKTYTVKTDEKTVGDALLKAGLTTDTEAIYTLDGITPDWDADRTYWAFYVNGENFYQGAFNAGIDKNNVYKFIVEKFDGEPVG